MTSARALLVVAVLGASATAFAEPQFAVREGYRCSQCHVNRTGGGKRTAFGYGWSLTHLDLFAETLPNAAASAPPAVSPWHAVDPNLNDYVSTGANVRVSSSTILAKKVHNSFDNTEANLYLEVAANDDLLLYADTSVAQGTVESREAFLSVHRGGLGLKAGYFLPPYGLRIWGDDEFIRRETGYAMSSPDLGLELGFETARSGVFLAVTNGSGGGADPDNAKKLSLWAEHAFARWRVGLSGSFNKSNTRALSIGGVYTGLALGRLTLLGEADVLYARYLQAKQDVPTLVTFAEADLLVRRGLNLKVTYGYHDPDLTRAEDQRISLRGGVEVAPLPFLMVSAFYTLGRSVPQDEVGNAQAVMGEVHLFF